MSLLKYFKKTRVPSSGRETASAGDERTGSAGDERTGSAGDERTGSAASSIEELSQTSSGNMKILLTMHEYIIIHVFNADTSLTGFDDSVELSSSGTEDKTVCSSVDDLRSTGPLAKRPALMDKTEIASFVGSKPISSDSKYQLLVNHFKPGPDYSFPKSSTGRSFQYQWLVQFPWLTYSKQEKGGFCLPCVLFVSVGYHGSGPGVLVSRPLTVFGKALELLRKHADKGYHRDAVVKSDEFVRVMTHQQPDIRSQLNQAMADKIASNRQKLSSIFKTIELCGRQNISLRGHRDNATDIEKDPSLFENHGNFRALLKFRVDAGDSILSEHLVTAPRNATYTSSNIQNQVIDIFADQIRQNIISRVKKVRWYSVVADEVTDISNKEQLSLVVRYVYHGGLRWRTFYLTELIYNFYYLILLNLSLIISVKTIVCKNALSNRDMHEHLRFIVIVVKIKL